MGSLLAAFIFLMLCSAFFSSSETALFSLSRVQVHRFKETDSRTASRIISLLKYPRQTLVTILFGNELANICISIVGAAMLHRILDLDVRLETIIAVAVITPIVMIACEIVPKNVAIRYAEQLVPMMSFPIDFFSKLISPLRRVLTWFARRMVVLFKGRMEEDEPMVMEEEFRRLVDIGRKEGAIEEEERQTIHRVFEFTDKRVGDIMTPASRLFALSVDMPFDRLMEEVRSTQFSRIPFYEGDASNIVGILHVRDLFAFQMRRRAGESPDLRDCLREPLFVTAATPLEDLLKEFQRTRMHMALVLDETGKVVGVVTMDDVQEELFGEMEE